MKDFLIKYLIFGVFILFGQFVCGFLNDEYLKFDIMFLFGIIASGIVRYYEICKEFKEQNNKDDEFNDYTGLY